jgi:type 1 glutamine amidotransferase
LVVLLASAVPAASPKRVLLLGQKRDHPPETHEYYSGLHVLQACLQRTPGLEVTQHRVDGAWTEGPELLAQADAIVLYLGEGARWVQDDPRRLQAIRALAARGGGIVALHWAAGARDAKYIPQFLELLGGMHGGPDRKYTFVETDVRVVDQHHPIMRGVDLLRLKDEFYYRLKFADKGRLTPLLQAKIEDRDETVAWAFERSGGGRSFGFVGMHYHDNWKLAACRRMVAQGLLWTLNLPVPEQGLPVAVTEEDLRIRDGAGTGGKAGARP